MNEMRKLMETIKVLGEDFDDEEHYDMKYAEIEKFQGRKIIITDLYDGDVYGILDKKHGPRFMISAPLWRGGTGPTNVTDDEVNVSSPTFDIDEKDEAFLKDWYIESISESIEEAHQGGKTEHSGAKKGQSAYYGRKKEFMGRLKHGKRFRRKAKTQVGEEVVEIIGEGRQFVDSASMVRWMMGALEQMQSDYSYSDDPAASFHDVLEDIDNLVNEMKDAKIKTSRPAPRPPRRPFSSRI